MHIVDASDFQNNFLSLLSSCDALTLIKGVIYGKFLQQKETFACPQLLYDLKCVYTETLGENNINEAMETFTNWENSFLKIEDVA